ncbi:MAG: tRNA uridine-5-carboxymethylaminomethyl(34) synthesis GTPase MnmE [Bacteroidaceae bacterium]|nr:tRNA uridine-5-carboxymethylaminomethyl(34) synthesis GTPase MnmE [Bacteroidaceae bacterium]
MTDTICALATAPGGALGIIRISGPRTLEILSRIFTRDLSAAQPNTLHYGHIREEGGEVVDEVVVSLFRAPHSYTAEDCAEISCHGSRYILNKVLETLVKHGCRMAQPGEFTKRAFLNGKMDLSQAEAVADLIASTNKATHQIALNQLRGHFSSKLALLREQLLKLTSLLELELDFSDHEDLEFADRSELQDLTKAIDQHITHLADTFQTGNALKNGIPVAIIGAPNVGKSTLLNALLGEERAIVSDIQGTTRDAIEDTMQLGGVTFRFIDTAGIRHTEDEIESLGIERSKAAAQRARIILLMTEPGVPYPEIDVREDQTVIRVINKSDKDTAVKPSVGSLLSQSDNVLHISAKYNSGLDVLREQLISTAPKTSDTDVIVTNARHYDALVRAHEAIQRVLDGLQMQLSGDILSEDLRQALNILAEITGGAITPQETLNNIFSHFCVGK